MTFIILAPALACPSLAKKGLVDVLLVAKTKEVLNDLTSITYSQWKHTKEIPIDKKDIEILSFVPDYHISEYVLSAYKKRGFTYLVRARITISEKKGLYQLNSPFSEDIPHIHRLTPSLESSDSAYLPEEPVTLHHPFYIGEKDFLNIAHISDSHIAARMEMLEDRWNTNFKDAWSQSSLSGEKPGDFSNFNDQFVSTMKSINADKDIDMIIHTGDITDYNRGYYNTKGENDFSEDYHRNRNWLLFYQLLYSNYEKPFFSVLGNHDYRMHPYPPNPILISRRIRELFNMAPMVNLTRNEMNTIHEDPHSLYITQNHLMNRDYAVHWYSLVVNPFLDYQVFYGRMALLFLDWNRREDHEKATPWARRVLSKGQWSMLTKWHKKVMNYRKKEKVVAVVAMHPAVFNPFAETGDEKLLTNPETNIFYESTLIDTYTENDLVDGTFRERRNEFIKLCLGNRNYGKGNDYRILPEKGIDLVLTGHAHRTGLYQIEGSHVYVRRPDTIKRAPLFCNAVCCGPIGIKNEKGGLDEVQLDLPGYHVIYVDDTLSVEVRHSNLVDIREDTRRDFGEVARGRTFEVADAVDDIPGLNPTYSWRVTNLKEGSTITRVTIVTGLKRPVEVTETPLGWRHFKEYVNGFTCIVCEAHDRGQGIFYSNTGEIKIKVDQSVEKIGNLTVSWDMEDDPSLPVCVRVPGE